jgi:hypothetical protein
MSAQARMLYMRRIEASTMTRPILSVTFCALLAAACGDAARPAQAPPSAAVPAAPVDAVGEAAGSYRLQAAFSPAEVGSGAASTLSLEIVMTRPDVHVQREFPLKVTLAPSAGVALAKTTLGHADAVAPDAKGRRWEATVKATGKGAQKVDASLRFAVCKETEPAWCVTRSELVSAALEVR